jgi:gluconokinase
MEALGLVESIDVAADLVPVDSVTEPDPAAARVYADLLPIFAGLYEPLQPAGVALAGLGLPFDRG